MNEIAGATFTAEFLRNLIHYEGLILFGLTAYWCHALWDTLVSRFSKSPLEQAAFFCAIMFGILYTFSFSIEIGSETLLFGTALGCALALALLDPTVAVSLLCSLLFLRPWEMIPGNDYLLLLPKFTFLICAAHAFLQLSARRSKSIAWNSTATFVAGFAVWAYIATFATSDPENAQYTYFESFFKSTVLFVVILNAIWSRRELNVLIGSLIFTFLGVGWISLAQTLGFNQSGGESRLIGIGAFANANDVAALMVLFVPFSIMKAFRSNEPWIERTLAGLLILLVGPCIWLSQSRGAMLGLAAAIAVCVLFRIRSRKINFLFLIGCVVLAFAYSQFSSRSGSDLSESSASRWEYLKAGVSMAIHNPLLGVGFDGYGASFEKYADQIKYEWGVHTAHNSWILVLAETGFMGLILFSGCFFQALKQSLQLFKSQPEFLSALVGYGVVMTFLSHSYVLYPYLLYGLIGVAHRVEYSTATLSYPSRLLLLEGAI